MYNIKIMKLAKFNKIFQRQILAVMIFTVWAGIVFTPRVSASSNPHVTSLSGPWEIVLKMGFEGEGLIVPLKISDRNRSDKLNITLTVPETTIKVNLDEYIPDLVWETEAVKYSGDGIAAKLRIKGKGLEQEVWLGSANPAKQSITSSIGGVAIKKLNDTSTVENIVKELTNPKAVGVLSVWPEESNLPVEFAVKVKDEIIVPKSEYKLAILDYMPHYSIEVAANKVVNLSDEPVNPAIKVAVNDGTKIAERWIWSKFMSPPHQEDSLPLRMQFTDFDPGKVDGRYFLVVANGNTPWLLYCENGKKKIQRAALRHSYLFSNKDYSFSIEKIVDGAIVETNWENKSDKLNSPAIITTVEQDGTSHQVVLELNKPYHYKVNTGTLVMLYRQSPNDKK